MTGQREAVVHSSTRCGGDRFRVRCDGPGNFPGPSAKGVRAVQHVYPRRPRCRQIDGTVRPPEVQMAESSRGGGKLTPPAIPGFVVGQDLRHHGGVDSAQPAFFSRGCRIDTPVAEPRPGPGRPTVVGIPHRRRTLMDLGCRYVTSPLAQAQGFVEKVRGSSRETGEPHDSRPKDRVEDVGGDNIDLLGGDDVAGAGDHLVRVPEQP